MIAVDLGIIFFGFGNYGQPVGLTTLTADGGFFTGGRRGGLDFGPAGRIKFELTDSQSSTGFRLCF